MIPKHVAIIMDGNRRWAKKNGVANFIAYRRAVKVAEKIIKCASSLGIKYITLYALSAENLKRSNLELEVIYNLLRSHLGKYHRLLSSSKVDYIIRFIGERQGLPNDVVDLIEKIDVCSSNIELSGGSSGKNASELLIVRMAINYGSRQSIVNCVSDTVNHFLQNNKSQKLVTAGEVAEIFAKCINPNSIPDPDFLIRTSGEQRLSNFLLWEMSYTEFYFPHTFWPDFSESEFVKALDEYKLRQRRYGK